MLEECIDASPSSLNRSLHHDRMHRKSKSRRLATSNSNTAVHVEFPEIVATSQIFNAFWDSENEENVQELASCKMLNPSNDFERFKEEAMLAVADQSECRTIRKARNDPSQMFQTCERLLETQQNPNTTEYLSCEVEAEDCFNVHTEWLLEPFEPKEQTIHQNNDETLKPTQPNACNDKNDIDFFNDDLDITFLDDGLLAQQAAAVETKYTKSIVDQILEDFCASLSSSSDDESKSVFFEPYFRFRKKKIRTYERRFRRPDVISNSVTTPSYKEDAALSDTSSELSLQETNTQLIPTVEPLVLEISGAVHNNLLDLSTFFTQNLLESGCNADVEDTLSSTAAMSFIDGEPDHVNDMVVDSPFSLLNEIHALRLKYENFSKPILCANSNDLLGFASSAEYEFRVAQMETTHFQNPVQEVLSRNSEREQINDVPAAASTEEKSKFSQQSNVATQSQRASKIANKRSNDSIIDPLPSCDIESSIFYEDIWQDDSEFFANFKTQAVLKTLKSNSPKAGRQSTSPFQNKTAKRDEPTDMVGSQIDVDDVLKCFEQPTILLKTSHIQQQYDENALKCDLNDMVLSEWSLDNYEAAEKESLENQGLQNVPKDQTKIENKQNNSTDVIAEKDDVLALFEKNEFWIEPFTQLDKQEPIANILCQPSTSKQAVALLANKQYKKKLEDQRNSQTIGNKFAIDVASNQTTDDTLSTPFIGFKTASSKIIHVTEKARKKAEQIFVELPDFPNDIRTRQEMAKVNTSKKANDAKVKEKLLTSSSQCHDDCENETNTILTECKRLEHEKHALVEIKNCSEQQQLETPQATTNLELQYNDTPASVKGHFPGFQTASSKPIIISEKAQKMYKNFFDEILKEDDNVAEELAEKRETNKQQSSASCKQDLKNVETNNKLLPQDNLQNQQQQKTSEINSLPTVKCMFAGFQTASAKPINITEKARNKYQNFFDEILKEDECNAEQKLAEKIESNHNQPATFCVDDFANIQLDEWYLGDSSPKQQQRQTLKTKSEITPKPAVPVKRKFKSLENTDSTAFEQPTKMLCKSYTMDDLSTQTPKNGNLRTSMSHIPITSSKAAIDSETTERTSNIIVRKNLLSLTKKRKSNLKHSLNQKTNNNNEINNVETPVKLMAAEKLSDDLTSTAQYTPNASEFYANMPDAASTPQTQHETPNRRLHALKSADNLDSDFKRINWEQIDDGKSSITSTTSASTPTRAENSSLNGTLKPVPSPQERIDNLSACGNPPPLPQIVTNGINRCRSLGLSKRCRRSYKQN